MLRKLTLAVLSGLLMASPAFADKPGKEEHTKKKVEEVKAAVKAQKEHPKPKADVAKDTKAQIAKVEAKIEVVVKIEHKIDDKAKGKHDDGAKKIDGACNKLADIKARLAKEEADAAAFAAHLLEKAYLEHLINELHDQVVILDDMIDDLDSWGLHEEANELDKACEEIEDVMYVLALDYIYLHLDEAGDQLDHWIEWAAAMDAWHAPRK